MFGFLCVRACFVCVVCVWLSVCGCVCDGSVYGVCECDVCGECVCVGVVCVWCGVCVVCVFFVIFGCYVVCFVCVWGVCLYGACV